MDIVDSNLFGQIGVVVGVRGTPHCPVSTSSSNIALPHFTLFRITQVSDQRFPDFDGVARYGLQKSFN
jgi:hypothetical protein